jgi:Xaa-Pro aminopeptidase
MLTPKTLGALQRAIADVPGLDGWLLYDFHGLNPIAAGILELRGMGTRRIFCFIPRSGSPVAITHAIEQSPWNDWPKDWGKVVYSSWRSLEEELAKLVKGKRVAMEYSPGDAVPYLDRIPAGVLEMVRAAGADVVGSGELVSRTHAGWSDAQLASHKRAAEQVARIAKEAMTRAGQRASSGSPVTEHELQQWIVSEFERHGLESDHGPIVAAGANAADPHYGPDASRPRHIKRSEILLIDLWARERSVEGAPGVYADQTWMASLGEPSPRAVEVWTTIRDARDAALSLLRDRLGAGQAVRGGEADDAARDVVRARGFAQWFPHRTGHSIDPRDLHGSGPHIDNLETREERALVPGVGFSIEPGVYVTGEIGMRTEVNAFVSRNGLVVTPAEPQRDLLVV